LDLLDASKIYAVEAKAFEKAEVLENLVALLGHFIVCELIHTGILLDIVE